MFQDRTRFVDRVGNESGGVYVINFKHIFGQLAAATMDNVVLERFGSKTLRIFRVIREKKYVEESQIQGIVMIPTKETKSLTYQLLENNFIHLQELRKSMVNTAPAKSFYLFYVDMNHVARTLLELCYKSLSNLILRKQSETMLNQRLLDKQDRIESIAANLRSSGEIEDENQLRDQLQDIQDMVKKLGKHDKLFARTIKMGYSIPCFRCRLLNVITLLLCTDVWTSWVALLVRWTRHCLC